jgi:hypothetical protein
VNLYTVTRETKPLTRNKRQRVGYVHYVYYAVMAETAADAEAVAMAHDPRTELDGPEVSWSVEEESAPIVKAGGGFRAARPLRKVAP